MNRQSIVPLMMAAAGVVLAAVAIFGILKNRSLWVVQTVFRSSTAQTDSAKADSSFSQSGKPAPDFELLALDGTKVSLSNFQGRPVLINFWATWCPPCLAELPLLQDRMEKHSPDLVVLAINSDEDLDTVKNFITKNNFTFPVLMDTDWKVESALGVLAYPTSIFIDRDGLIQAKYVGEISADTLDAYLKLIGVSE